MSGVASRRWLAYAAYGITTGSVVTPGDGGDGLGQFTAPATPGRATAYSKNDLIAPSLPGSKPPKTAKAWPSDTATACAVRLQATSRVGPTLPSGAIQIERSGPQPCHAIIRSPLAPAAAVTADPSSPVMGAPSVASWVLPDATVTYAL